MTINTQFNLLFQAQGYKIRLNLAYLLVNFTPMVLIIMDPKD